MFVAATLNMQTLIDTFLMCYEVILHKCMHNDNNYYINCEFTTQCCKIAGIIDKVGHTFLVMQYIQRCGSRRVWFTRLAWPGHAHKVINLLIGG